MGGIVCAIHFHAIFGGTTLPTPPANASDLTYANQCVGFDAKIRQAYNETDLAHGIEDANLGLQVCAILEKDSWTPKEREFLWNSLLSLWPEYE